MKTKEKIVKLVEMGLSPTTVVKLNETQIDVLLEKLAILEQGAVIISPEKAEPQKLKDLTSRGINVRIETEMTETIRSEKFRERIMSQVPMGRFASPQEVSQPVCFLLSQAASYITGQHLSVNGGYTIGV